MDLNVKLIVSLSKMHYWLFSHLNKDLKNHGMNSSEYSILAHLNVKGKEKTQKLGEISMITSGTITHTINKLVSKGYVTQAKDPSDRRISWVSITALGQKQFELVHIKHLEEIDRTLNAFSIEEKTKFIRYVRHFGTILEKIEKENHND